MSLRFPIESITRRKLGRFWEFGSTRELASSPNGQISPLSSTSIHRNAFQCALSLQSTVPPVNLEPSQRFSMCSVPPVHLPPPVHLRPQSCPSGRPVPPVDLVCPFQCALSLRSMLQSWPFQCALSLRSSCSGRPVVPPVVRSSLRSSGRPMCSVPPVDLPRSSGRPMCSVPPVDFVLCPSGRFDPIASRSREFDCERRLMSAR